MSGLNYEELAEASDALREGLQALVAGLMQDGFTDREARVIVAGMFANNFREEEDE